ncbi:unnamed protein product [Darwinula stevensoni]|uniref:Uncharacterized protein n=1 Tax=Darwinula stevensoni TaxID=69355 RepID=A0A7R8XDR5_9CRUS|nr:unnamed protein product [Darwinula stevensoni]CAG0889865.1 unnamed protein product [Darwinula stevensoni]
MSYIKIRVILDQEKDVLKQDGTPWHTAVFAFRAIEETKVQVWKRLPRNCSDLDTRNTHDTGSNSALRQPHPINRALSVEAEVFLIMCTPSIPCLLLVFLFSSGILFSSSSARAKAQRGGQGASNENIKEAILSMQGSLLALGDKLQRHEYRSNHVGEQTLQSLRRLDGARAGADKNMENIAVQLGRMDVRIAKMEKLMEQENQHEREQLMKISDTIASLVQLVSGRIDQIQEVAESNGEIIKRLRRIERKSETALESSGCDKMKDLEAQWEKNLKETETSLNLFRDGIKLMSEQLDLNPEKEEKRSTGMQLVVEALRDLNETVSKGFRSQEQGMAAARADAEIGGLGKLEQVMLDSADLVLSTKKRLEYGIQQILQEVGDAVKTQSARLDESLSKEIVETRTWILGNQSQELREVTQGLDGEIKQVWRQIGVLYNQLSLSQDVLMTVENQTKTYVNGSLDKVGRMNNQVGMVMERMADVEDNLNYLLGRMSLVVDEFNQMKKALGDQFNALRSDMDEVNKGVSPEEKLAEEGVGDVTELPVGPIQLTQGPPEETTGSNET